MEVIVNFRKEFNLVEIKIKKLQINDAEQLYQFEVNNRSFFETMVPSRGDDYYQYNNYLATLENLLMEQREGLSYFYLIKDQNGTILGRINLVDIDRETGEGHVGYRVGEAFLRKGIASRALQLLLQEALMLKVNTIYAKTTYDNIASQKVLENSGFIPNMEEKEKNQDFVHYIWKS
jgi:[ribosomal protein S5]-alanine N-acetyltransferase